MEEATIIWTEYMKYRLRLRGYDLATVEHILRYSSERYADTVTGRLVAIGRHMNLLVMIPYKQEGGTMTPVTSRPERSIIRGTNGRSFSIRTPGCC